MVVSNRAFGEEFEWEGHVHSVASPGWMRPCFAIPLITIARGSNALYVQEVTADDLVTGLSPFDAPAELMATVTNPVRAVVRAKPAIHAVIGPDGVVLAGTRQDLSPIVSKWLDRINWPVTRLAFADFVGDERQIMAAADAAIKDKAKRLGRAEALTWFATSVVFSRLQRATLITAATQERRLELEAALDQVRIEVKLNEVVAHVPPVLMDLFDGANVLAKPGLALAHKLAMLISPSGLTLKEKPKETALSPGQTPSKQQAPTPPGGEFAELWIQLQYDNHNSAWPLRWKSAWDKSSGHPDFEQLGLSWLASHNVETTAQNGGLILTALLDERYRAIKSDRPFLSAARWLKETLPSTPRWGKVWLRLAEFTQLPGGVVGLAEGFLRTTHENNVSHSDWTQVWSLLKILQPERAIELNQIAVTALPSFNRQPKFAKRVAIPLFDPQEPTKVFPEIWHWFNTPENMGNAWAEFYLHLIRVRPETTHLLDMGLLWLERAPRGVKRWARVWEATFNAFGPKPDLMVIGEEYLGQLTPEQRSTNAVAVIIALSREAEDRARDR